MNNSENKVLWSRMLTQLLNVTFKSNILSHFYFSVRPTDVTGITESYGSGGD